MNNDDVNNDMPDWCRDTDTITSSSLQSLGNTKRDSESSRLLKRQSLLRGNNTNRRESLGTLSPPITTINEYDDDDIECFGSFFDPVLLWFRTFHVLSCCVGIATTIANIYVLSKYFNVYDVRDVAIRLYTIICSMLIVISEIDWRYVMHRVRILDLWFFRGLFFCIVGFLTISDGPLFQNGIQPQDICGFIEISMGIIYVVFGIFCVKSIKLQHLAKYESKSNNEKVNPIGSEDFVSV